MKIFTYIKNDSSRIDKKNFKNIGNLELWKHLIYELGDFDVFIDTDSPRVISECNADILLKNVTAYEREQEFVDMENDPNNSLSPSLLMIDNFLDKYVEDDDEQIVLTHVTSPFLKKETVLDALTYLSEDGGKYDSVHSVYSVQDFCWRGRDYKPINFVPSVVQRTQDLEKMHFSNGAFFIFTKKTFKKNNNRFGENVYYYRLNRVESIEVDNREDLELARIVYRGLEAR